MKQINKMPAILIATAMFVLGSGSVFAGAFDFQKKLEFGLGAGFNTDYWGIGGSKVAPRSGVPTAIAGNDPAQAGPLSVNGINADAQINYHILPLAFL